MGPSRCRAQRQPKGNTMKKTLKSMWLFISRWRATKNCEIPEAFHNAFNHTLDRIVEQERIHKQWQDIWCSHNNAKATK